MNGVKRLRMKNIVNWFQVTILIHRFIAIFEFKDSNIRQVLVLRGLMESYRKVYKLRKVLYIRPSAE